MNGTAANIQGEDILKIGDGFLKLAGIKTACKFQKVMVMWKLKEILITADGKSNCRKGNMQRWLVS